MKIFKKLNKGLLLFIILLILLVVYLINLEISRKNDKPKIQELCQEYVNSFNKYSLLEKNYQTIDRSISDAELDEYLSNAKTDFTKIFDTESNMLEQNMKIIKSNLNSQFSGYYLITELKRDITSYDKFSFDGDKVIVEFTSYAEIKYLEKDKASYDNQTKKYTANAEEKSYANTMKDRISFKKVDGTWKIVYTSVYLPNSDASIYNVKTSGQSY